METFVFIWFTVLAILILSVVVSLMKKIDIFLRIVNSIATQANRIIVTKKHEQDLTDHKHVPKER